MIVKKRNDMTEKVFLFESLSDIFDASVTSRMRDYIQHGQISTFEHCFAVAFYSLKWSRLMRIRTDEKSLVRGAFLHDFYLYDWHISDRNHRFHGFSHADTALRNAKTFFAVNEKEAGIIQTHMWPLTVRRRPRSKEAVFVCLADKYCSLREVFGLRYRQGSFVEDNNSFPHGLRRAHNG